MHGSALTSLALASLYAGLSSAAPTPTRLDERGLVDGLAGSIQSGLVNAGTGLIGAALNAPPTATPSSVPAALKMLDTIVPNGQIQLTSITGYTMNGFVPNGGLMQAVTKAAASSNNQNKDPDTAVFPQKDPADAPYSLSESQLRTAINIPSGFTYGAKPPVIMVPGTGSTGDLTFQDNMMKVLAKNADVADPVTLNVPNFLLDDAQTNAEYVAYAMNYMSAVSKNQNVSVVAWSQGNLNTQWAMKYFPSTRAVMSDFISVSPDFKGTQLANIAGPAAGLVGGTAPSVLQQASTSNFVKTLMTNDGDSAYVPTTTIYSSTDEVVQPQDGNTASAFMKDARNVGVSNTQIQVACPGMPAGANYLHEGMLFNPMAAALMMDALKNPGPGDLSRIDKNAVCNQQVPDGLTTQDVLSTSGNIPLAVSAVLMLPDNLKVTSEPQIMSYAT